MPNALPDLHDAVLLGVFLNPVGRSAELRLAYYPDADASERVEGILRFSGVTEFHQLIDFDLLASHAAFGNVTQCVTGERPGVTHISLARGWMAVTAASVSLTQGG
jgi:hypothetical protein